MESFFCGFWASATIFCSMWIILWAASKFPALSALARNVAADEEETVGGGREGACNSYRDQMALH